MRAAIAALRQQNPARIIVAVPVGAPDACAKVRDDADEIVCGQMPDSFCAVGFWYDDFTQTTDDEVIDLLDTASKDYTAFTCGAVV